MYDNAEIMLLNNSTNFKCSPLKKLIENLGWQGCQHFAKEKKNNNNNKCPHFRLRILIRFHEISRTFSRSNFERIFLCLILP